MADEETTDEDTPKFIDFQEDPARPGQHIDCADELAYEESTLESCPSCVPDPDAIVPDWINENEPFLNRRTCEYQVMMVTEYEGTGGDDLQNRMDEYINPGIRRMMRHYGKLETDAIVEAFSVAVGAVEYHLGGPDRTLPRPYMKMRVLIAAPAVNFDNLEDSPDEDEAEAETQTSTFITLDYNTLKEQVRKTKLIFRRYHTFSAIYWQSERGMVVHEDGSPINYSIEANNIEMFLSGIRSFMQRKHYVEWAPSWSGKKIINKITINLNDEMQLQSVELSQPGCNPEVFSGNSLETLRETTPFNSPTTLHFVVNLDSIVSDITAREPPPWLEFSKKYFYPQVHVNYGLGTGDQDGVDTQSALGCYVDNLELGSFATSFLEQAYSLPDAIAYKFNKKLCYPQSERKKRKEEEEDDDTLWTMATTVALEEYCKGDPLFQDLPEKIKNLGKGAFSSAMLAGTGVNASMGKDRIKEAWSEIFDRLRKCGLTSLMLDAIKCLLAGVDLTSALKTMIKSALSSMTSDNLQNLYVGLPPSEQARVDGKMQEIWGKSEHPWQFNVDEISNTTQEVSQRQTDQVTKATLSPPSARDERREGTYKELKDAYFEAIFRAYADDVDDLISGDAADRLMILVEHLNGFPGAEIIARVIATFDCPEPPGEKEDRFLDWYKDIDLSFCNETDGLHIPKFPKRQGVNRKDVMALLMETAKEAARAMALKMLTDLLMKLMQSWTSMLCDTLGAIGEAATTDFPNAAFDSPSGFLLDAVRDSFCGSEASDEEALNTLEQMFGNIGAVSAEDAEEMSGADSVQSLISNVESILTRGELYDLMNGDCADYVLSMIDELLNTENTSFRDALPNKDAICRLFSNFGDFLPKEVLDTLDYTSDRDNNSATKPAMISLCACDETLQTFKDMRCALLQSKGDGTTEEQCDQQYDQLKDKALDDLEQLTNILQNGPMEDMPNLVSEGPCDTNALLPADTEETLEMAGEVSNMMLKILRNSITNDLIGRWGLLNLILSDTNGLSYTRHNMRVQSGLFFPNYSDFVGQKEDGLFEDLFGETPDTGMLPATVARWLRDYMNGEVPDKIDLNMFGNEVRMDFTLARDAPFKDTIEVIDAMTMTLSDVDGVDYSEFAPTDPITNEPIISITIPKRKKPDLVMYFSDNNRGQTKFSAGAIDPDDPDAPAKSSIFGNNDSEWVYGFRLEYSNFTLQSGEIPTDFTDQRSYRIKINDLSPAHAMALDLENASIYELASKYSPGGWSTPGAEHGVMPGLQHNIVGHANIDPDAAILAAEYASGITFGEHSPTSLIFAKHFVNTLSDAGLPSAAGDLSMVNEIITNTYNGIFNKMTTGLRNVIADPASNVFVYGYEDEELTADDAQYLDPTSDSSTLIPYDLAEEMGVLGVSAHSVTAGTGNRVHFLDPSKYGGRYSNPPLYITAPKRYGWLGLAEALVPEYSGCEPRRADLIDFQNIKDRIDELHIKLTEDERLYYNPNCVNEVPYGRILEKTQAANLEGIVMAAIRVYAAEHIVKAMPVFSKYAVIDDTFVMYIINEMEAEMLSEGSMFGKLRRSRYWYAFLEQCVQVQSSRWKLGEYEPNSQEANAFSALEQIQVSYVYPQDTDLQAARNSSEVVMGEEIRAITLLKKYRLLKNIEAVAASADIAKILLKGLVAEQVEHLIDKLRGSMRHLGLDPKITSMQKHFIGTSRMCMGPEFKIDIETYKDTSEGSEYIAGEYDAVTGIQDLGNVSNVAKTIDENPLDNHSSTIALQMASGLYDLTEGQFIVEKYIYMEGNTATIKGDRWQEGGPKITDDDYELRGVVNVDNFVEWLNRLSDDMKSANLADYFGDLSFAYPEGTVYTDEGETSENAMHVHEYLIDENGNGIAYTAYPPSKPWLSHTHTIEDFVVQSAYSPAAKERHVHDLQTMEVGGEGAEPIGVEGSIGVKYGLRLSYIASSAFASALEAAAGSELESDAFMENARLQKAFKVSESTTVAGLYSSSETSSSSDASNTQYIIPIASVEIDFLDETFQEIIDEFESNDNDVSPEVLACLGSKLSKSPEVQLLFDYCIPLNGLAGLYGIYTSRAFLPAIGESVGDIRDDVDGEDEYDLSELDYEWQLYGHKRMEGTERRKDRREILGSRMGPAWDNTPIAPGLFSPQKHPLEKTFAKTKRKIRNLFLSTYNHRDFNYDLPGLQFPNFAQMLRSRFWLGNFDEILTWRQRRSLVNSPYDKDGNECD